MNRILLAITAATLMLVTTFTAQAADLKIGVVNVREVIQRSPQSEDIQKKLEKEFSKRKDDILAARQSLQTKIQKFQRDGDVLSDDEVKKSQEEIINVQNSLEQMEREYQKGAVDRQREETEKLVKVISEIVNDIAAKEKYDIILHRDAAPFVLEKMDLTAKVLEKVLQQSKKS